ncbi:MAG: ammonium transporter, partial [Planctomycetes bacterium]|nr:ammonium transporter [Planctomycetota bacterium]
MKKKIFVYGFLLLMLFFSSPVFADDVSVAAVDAAKEELQLNVNIVWTCIAAFLVFFMQPGF